MPEVLFARRSCNPAQIIHCEGHDFEKFLSDNGLGHNSLLTSGAAYAPVCQGSQDRCIIRGFNALTYPEKRCLAATADTLGEETQVLAAFIEQNLNPDALKTVNGLVGAGATAANSRLNGFHKALLEYQNALMELQQKTNQRGRGVGHGRHVAKQKIKQSYQRLLSAYATELQRLSPLYLRGRNRGNALSNPQRGIVLATRHPSAKPDPRLNVASTIEAKRLQNLSRFMNRTGKAAVVLDASLRTKGVYQTYQEDGDWMREASVQMAGFGAGGAAGGFTGKVVISGGTAIAAKSGLALAGPAGWAVLGVIVGTGLLSGFIAGSTLDRGFKQFTNWIWDYKR